MTNLNITKDEYLRVARKYGLTKRELELGYLKVSGFSNRRIAYMLGISEQTVKNHFTHIYEKASGGNYPTITPTSRKLVIKW